MARFEVSNRSYESLARIGTRSNPNNAVMFEPNNSEVIGVNIEQKASKKAVKLELVIPISRSELGSRRTANVQLSGKQARELYETLSEFYSTRD